MNSKLEHRKQSDAQGSVVHIHQLNGREIIEEFLLTAAFQCIKSFQLIDLFLIWYLTT